MRSTAGQYFKLLLLFLIIIVKNNITINIIT